MKVDIKLKQSDINKYWLFLDDSILVNIDYPTFRTISKYLYQYSNLPRDYKGRFIKRS